MSAIFLSNATEYLSAATLTGLLDASIYDDFVALTGSRYSMSARLGSYAGGFPRGAIVPAGTP